MGERLAIARGDALAVNMTAVFDKLFAAAPDGVDRLAAGREDEGIEPENDMEREFLSERRNIEDFKAGLCVPGKLRPKRIPGGIVLVDTTFQFKEG